MINDIFGLHVYSEEYLLEEKRTLQFHIDLIDKELSRRIAKRDKEK